MQETGLTVALSDGLAVSVVAKETEPPVHAGSIEYIQGHVWGSKSMILQKDFIPAWETEADCRRGWHQADDGTL